MIDRMICNCVMKEGIYQRRSKQQAFAPLQLTDSTANEWSVSSHSATAAEDDQALPVDDRAFLDFTAFQLADPFWMYMNASFGRCRAGAGLLFRA